MNIFIKKILLVFILITFTQSCSTAVTVVDTTTSVAISTVKSVVHYSTCPFTKKRLFLIYNEKNKFNYYWMYGENGSTAY